MRSLKAAKATVIFWKSFTASAPTSDLMAALCSRWRCNERKDGRAREVAGLIEGAAQRDEFEAHWQTARVNDYGRDVYLDAEATALSLKALVANQSGQSTLLAEGRALAGEEPPQRLLLAFDQRNSVCDLWPD